MAAMAQIHFNGACLVFSYEQMWRFRTMPSRLRPDALPAATLFEFPAASAWALFIGPRLDFFVSKRVRRNYGILALIQFLPLLP